MTLSCCRLAAWSSCFHFNCMVINVHAFFTLEYFVLFAIIHAPQVFPDCSCLFKSNLQLFTVNITKITNMKRFTETCCDDGRLISGINWKHGAINKHPRRLAGSVYNVHKMCWKSSIVIDAASEKAYARKLNEEGEKFNIDILKHP